MRVLITSILCHSGLMTHVRDLIRYLQRNGVFVAAAFKQVNFLNHAEEEKLLQTLVGVPCWRYNSTDELEAIARDNNCNLIHAHSHATFSTATDVALRLDIPLVVTLHSVFPWDLSYRHTLTNAKQIIAVGPAQAKSAFLSRDRITVIANGVDTSQFVPDYDRLDERIDGVDGVTNVLWYGRVDGRSSRGLRMLDRIAPQLPDNIVIRALGTADVMLRNIPHIAWTDDPVPYLQEAHITFAHGRALREAMASGSIGMRIGYGYGGLVTEEGLRDNQFVTDAFPQYRLPRPKQDTIMADISDIVQSGNIPALRREARRIAERHFDIDVMGEKTVQVYHDVVD